MLSVCMGARMLSQEKLYFSCYKLEMVDCCGGVSSRCALCELVLCSPVLVVNRSTWWGEVLHVRCTVSGGVVLCVCVFVCVHGEKKGKRDAIVLVVNR